MVEAALKRFQENGSKTLPVTHNGQLVGLITSENVTEYLMIRSALKTVSSRQYGNNSRLFKQRQDYHQMMVVVFLFWFRL